MIDFACKRFSLDEVIRCGLGLTKSDFAIMSLLVRGSNYFLTTVDISKKTGLDLSTVQRSVKKLYERKILVRKQENLKNGGYIFYYKAKSRKEIKDIVLKIVDNWSERVEKELIGWR